MDKIDPVADDWTGTFRDGRPVNPLGPKPENAVTGTIYTVNAWRNDPLLVPIHYGAHRFWRHTIVAARAAEAAAKIRAQQSQRSDGGDASSDVSVGEVEVEIDGEEAGDGVVALVQGILGHEWDEDVDNGFRPPGLQRLSKTVVDNVQYICTLCGVRGWCVGGVGGYV